ncbi:carboxypeptidase C (cathepsin A)-like protein [Burkholderia ambifaria MEX-5]|uniref:Carboxypeptidase C (Cathepsin A)-like protein n=1 Tax=Burkholderia ambifaria MEX-5 TaxID=396597 RepID=B1T7H6_9BURK|nr:carboxypeptidase C (cathepsin A)-like protein [Burkholderia ambifaria MEX-5]
MKPDCRPHFGHTDPTGANHGGGNTLPPAMTNNCPSGRMIDLNDAPRTALKGDLGNFYDGILANRTALQRVLKLQARTQQLKQQLLKQQGQ